MTTQADGDDVLEVLYRMVNGELARGALLAQMKMHFDSWTDDRFFDAVEALAQAQHVEMRRNQYVALMLSGLRRVEEMLNPPASHTHNTVHIGSAVNSPIQQAGAGATQVQINRLSTDQSADLAKLVEHFERHLDELGLEPAAERKAKAQVATIKAQLEDDEPDQVIVNQAGRTLRSVTEGAIGSLVATAVQGKVTAGWTAVATMLASLF